MSACGARWCHCSDSRPTSQSAGPPEESPVCQFCLEVGALVDEHLHDLYSAACLILGDRGAAATATAEAFDDVWATTATPPGRVTKHEIIHHLHVRCMKRAEGHGSMDDKGGSVLGARPSGLHEELHRLSLQQRSAIALALCGELTHRQIADVLSLSVPEVADLMRSAVLAIARGASTD